MGCDMLVPFLITLVLADKPEVVALDDNSAGHLRGLHDALEDTPTDANVAGERALLVDVSALMDKKAGGWGDKGG